MAGRFRTADIDQVPFSDEVNCRRSSDNVGMKRSDERILTTHTGSLPRPDALMNMALERNRGGDVPEAAYDAAVAQAVDDIVRKQVELGVDVVDDGEQSKSGFIAYLNERLAGYEHYPPPPRRIAFEGSRELLDFPEYYAQHSGPGGHMNNVICTGPISYKGDAELQRDLANLKHAVAGQPVTEVFVPCASPASVEGWQKNSYYKKEDEYLYAIAEAMRHEYLAVIDAGFLLQLDDPFLAMHYMLFPDATVADVVKWGQLRVEALNHAVRGIPADRIRYHTCYGINMGPRTSDLELKHFVNLVLSVHAGAFSFEAANPRHAHEWKLWQDVKLPDDKIIIPGVITHTSVLVEHPEVVAQQIIRFARTVGRERVIAGSDCGFATNPGGIPEVHPTIVWAKFAALAEGARLASETLWKRT
jgi:5-methyltetrahydropteroyltriglutamate--homocysteine methyltransferase